MTPLSDGSVWSKVGSSSSLASGTHTLVDLGPMSMGNLISGDSTNDTDLTKCGAILVEVLT